MTARMKERRVTTLSRLEPFTPNGCNYQCNSCGSTYSELRSDCLDCGDVFANIKISEVEPAPVSAIGASLEDYKRRATTTYEQVKHDADCYCFDCVPYGTDKVMNETNDIRERVAAMEKAGITLHNTGAYVYTADDFESAVQLAVVAEREACAKIADDTASKCVVSEFIGYGKGIAALIRARNDAPQDEHRHLWGTVTLNNNQQVEVCLGCNTGKLPGREYEHAADCATYGDEGKDCDCQAPISHPLAHLRSDDTGWTGKTSVQETIAPNGIVTVTGIHSVVIGDVLYGFDGEGIFRIGVDVKPDRTFTAPVAAYIKEQGWKWEEVTVREYPLWYGDRDKHQIGFINTTKNIVLVYHVERNCWSSPINI